jgi:hypothetical protein
MTEGVETHKEDVSPRCVVALDGLGGYLRGTLSVLATKAGVRGLMGWATDFDTVERLSELRERAVTVQGSHDF